MSELSAFEKFQAFHLKYGFYPNRITPGQVIEVESVEDFQFIKMEEYADHKSSLDYLKGV